VTGEQGIGKTALSDLFACALKAIGADPIVVKSFDPTAGMLTIDPIIEIPTSQSPVILLIDEYPNVIKASEETNKDNKKQGLTNSRGSWLSLMDRLAEMPYLIVIATGNVKLAELDPAYVREGRFHIRKDITV